MRTRIVLLAVLVLVFSPGCLPPARVPLETLSFSNDASGQGKIAIVFLPGNGDTVAVFRTEGLVAAVREQGLSADMIAVNAHLGYYRNGTVLTRLKADVIDPVRSRNYEQVWIVGNSLGGYGALSYAREHPRDIDGVVLLGPYLGRSGLIREIKESGGLASWTPDLPGQKNWEDHWGKMLWLGLKERLVSGNLAGRGGDCSSGSECFPLILLGYGRGDRFSDGQAYLGSCLPPDQVLAIDGGHDWTTWSALWQRVLDRGLIPSR